mmetsp:Transcript_109369/g.211754  ORF Transcript_109369/g.211754 Transcript_109369/m.211754 type:complete len:113 (+) Transcript_109369:73-411(+)
MCKVRMKRARLMMRTSRAIRQTVMKRASVVAPLRSDATSTLDVTTMAVSSKFHFQWGFPKKCLRSAHRRSRISAVKKTQKKGIHNAPCVAKRRCFHGVPQFSFSSEANIDNV